MEKQGPFVLRCLIQTKELKLQIVQSYCNLNINCIVKHDIAGRPLSILISVNLLAAAVAA